ncbi:MAG: methyl-accepting chemotaxis protein, partial [Pseudomonadota bacterium]|nr:methyl-accepting chemotaxis protein [Pseudomonadota bacterium]
MSFLSKLQGLGHTGNARSPADGLEGELAFEGAYPQPGRAAASAVALPLPAAHGVAGFDSAPAAHAESVAGSIIAESLPSETDFTETRQQDDAAGVRAGALPLIGNRPIAEQQRILAGLVGLGLFGLILLTIMSVVSAGRGSAQVAASGQALMQSQRLAKSVSQALIGSAQAFPEVRDSAEVLAKNVRSLKTGEGEVAAVPGSVQTVMEAVLPLVDRAEKNAATIVSQQQVLTKVNQSLRAINRQSADLLEVAETVSSLKLQREATPAELSAVGQLVMLTQRIGKSANEFLTTEGVSPEAVFLLGKDLNSFRELGEGLLDGNQALRLPGTKDPQTRERLTTLMQMYEQTRAQAGTILGNLQGLTAAREAQASIIADSEPLRKGLESVQERLGGETGVGIVTLAFLVLAALVVILGGAGLVRLRVNEQQNRRLEAEGQEHEAKRVNDANQAAILRLMNELQGVAEGDLTQQATVTEDITGAIADSVNYTVEELRTLVSQVQGTAGRVTETTEKVESNSTELLATSSEQLREIRDTGESVLQMAGRINDVSSKAQETAQVAKQSLDAAEEGLRAVQNTIGGMNSIRDQIQETSKRIKRLGESSQEIGEITELISDITEQTNVLAL